MSRHNSQMPQLLYRICPVPARYWALPLGVIVLFVTVQAAGAVDAWRFSHPEIASGAWWRLLTAHFGHLGWIHLLLNAAGLLLLFCLFGERLRPVQWLAAILLFSLAVGVGLYLFSPGVDWYVGFSGTLHGLFVLGAAAALAGGDRTGGGVLALFAAKLAWEQWRGDASTAALIGANVVVDAHLYGAVAGLAYGLPLLLRRRQP